jgi:hypothetical protein
MEARSSKQPVFTARPKLQAYFSDTVGWLEVKTSPQGMYFVGRSADRDAAPKPRFFGWIHRPHTAPTQFFRDAVVRTW